MTGSRCTGTTQTEEGAGHKWYRQAKETKCGEKDGEKS